MKHLTALAAGLAALFLLSACDDDQGNEGANNPNNSHNTAETGKTVREDRLIEVSFNITATGANDDPADDRALHVTATAYCEEFQQLGDQEYREQCGGYVQKSLEYYAADRECFEGAFAAVSPDVRNHSELPQNENDLCYDEYPPNYASWTEDMLKRAVDRTTEDNFYTVTKIEPR